MKIKKIQTIKGYKSFLDFQWDYLCKNRSSQICYFSPFTLIFGENGSGKSSVCDILKDLTGFYQFEGDKPNLTEVELETTTITNNTAPDGKVYPKKETSTKTYKYEQQNWDDSPKEPKHILFFDVDFIDKNIHSHGTISNLKGCHTQNAGNLIIGLDEEANKQKDDISDKKTELKTFELTNKDILHLPITAEERVLYNKYKDTKKKEIEALFQKTLQEIAENKKARERLTKLLSKTTQIAGIQRVNQLSERGKLSVKSIYSEIFIRDIKQATDDKTDSAIKNHFLKHKSFLEKDDNYKKITDAAVKECPLCMQSLSGATKIIKFYKKIFDMTYEDAKRKYLTDIQGLETELTDCLSNVESLQKSISSIFSSLEKINQEFEIKDLYNVDEKLVYNKKFEVCEKSIKLITEILQALEQLKSLEKKSFSIDTSYESIVTLLAEVDKLIVEFNKFVGDKNKKIDDFKQKYSEQKNTNTEIQGLDSKLVELEGIFTFIKADKIGQIKKYDENTAAKTKLDEEITLLEENLEKYLAEKIPGKIIDKMKNILGRFNLNFCPKHIELFSNTKEYPFSFSIFDKNNKQRAFKEGLSEGERQIISLSLFFAINENLSDKQDTVIVLDDPITSLDAPNLKILSDLIHEQTKEFGQIIVFTHHPLFYKYLFKCEDPNPMTFGIAKNRDEFGGSFIFSDPGFDLLKEVKDCYKEITEQAKNGNLRLEAIALKYGQLLRLAVERFIKNDLLMWDKEKDFSEITDSLIAGKGKIVKLDDVDLERVKNIYKYCSYSNLLHADKEIPSAISELDNHIAEFIKITEKVN